MISDMHVWIDSEVVGGQTVVIPYVKSEIDRRIYYKLDVVRNGGSGTTRISQGGNVLAPADKSVQLSRTSINVRPNDACTLEIVLTEKDMPIGKYQFDCPR